jgi:hypothetical protein
VNKILFVIEKVSFLVLLGMNLFLTLVDIEKMRWFNSKPKLLNFLNKYKMVINSFLLTQYCLILFCLILILYELNGILIELTRVQSFRLLLY